MTELTTFHYHDVAVRTQRDDSGEPLFCLADVCRVLEITDTSNTTRQLKEEFSCPVLNTAQVFDPSGAKTATFITEPQLR